MLKTILVLPDGTEVSSGTGTVNAIRSVTLTECVNDSEELTLGSTCSNALEVTLITPAGGLALDAGTEVVMHKESGGVRQQIGVFILEKPTRPSANTMKVTGYDRVSKLDKDLTAWLSGLTGWPYTLTAFAGMVCEACGLTFKVTDVPNGDFLVDQFTRSSVTGRQLMQWLGEICCRFCRADPFGEIEFAWYTDSGKAITPTGELYYFQNSLTYEDYTTVEIEAVQIRMADSENGALWPTAEDGVNSYIIAGNPILNLRITEDLVPVLANIEAALAGVRYTPCKVSVPANLDIRAGNTVQVTDKNGKTFTAYVMTKTQAGQKDTLECTGSHRRDTPAAVSNQSEVAAAQKALDNMTFEDFVMKLTKEGKIKGMFVKDGELCFNATFIITGELLADLIKAGTIKSKDGESIVIDLDNGTLDAVGTLRTLWGSDESAYQSMSEMTHKGFTIGTLFSSGTVAQGAYLRRNALLVTDDHGGSAKIDLPYDTSAEASFKLEKWSKMGTSFFRFRALSDYDSLQSMAYLHMGSAQNQAGLAIMVSPDEVAIHGLTTPTGDSDAVNKKYVDDLIAALKSQLGL